MARVILALVYNLLSNIFDTYLMSHCKYKYILTTK
jgi:hypothetical protein